MAPGRHSGRRCCGWRTRVHAATIVAAFTTTPAAAVADDLVAPARTGLASSIASWQRLAPNALLVPLLEPEGPLSWAASNEMRPCRDDSVTVDGHPLPLGQRIAIGRPQVVVFRLDDCWPLGTSWIGLTGTLEMRILNEGPRVSVMVRPLQLSAAIDGVRVPITGSFAAVVSLDVARSRP